MFLMMVNGQRQRINSWRHSHGDHTLDNPVSVVILEWTPCFVMFCVIVFGECPRSLFSLDAPGCPVTDAARSACPTSRALFFTVSVPASVQVNERGGAGEEREEQRKQNGGLYEEAAPKQHRKPERTLRYTDTTTHNQATCRFPLRPSWGLPGLMNYSRNKNIFNITRQNSCPSLLSVKTVCLKNLNNYLNAISLYNIAQILRIQIVSFISFNVFSIISIRDAPTRMFLSRYTTLPTCIVNIFPPG